MRIINILLVVLIIELAALLHLIASPMWWSAG